VPIVSHRFTPGTLPEKGRPKGDREVTSALGKTPRATMAAARRRMKGIAFPSLAAILLTRFAMGVVGESQAHQNEERARHLLSSHEFP
jgi:hypothetical protein